MEKLFQLLRRPPLKKSKEKEEHSLEFEFIDETSADQPYVQNGELHHFLDFFNKSTDSVFSGEGYAHNEEKQRQVGRVISWLFNLSKRGEILDVGWGANKYVAQGIKEKRGNVSLLDYYDPGITDGEGDLVVKPITRNGQVDNFPRYVGDFGQISAEGSELADKKFGAIIFNGSWTAFGNNWTIMETLSSQYVDTNNYGGRVTYSTPQYQDYISLQLDRILAEGKKHLTDDGVMFFSSSRYAFHGVGYSFLSLPEEKIQLLDLIRRVKKLGAKKITILGVSNEGMEKMFQENVGTEDRIKSRIMQIVFKFFVGGIRGPKYELKINDRKMSYSERVTHFSDEANVNKLLEESPKVAALIQAELERANSRGKEVLKRLTGGVAALMCPDSSLSQQTNVQQVISELKDVFPQQIARIDAIAIEF